MLYITLLDQVHQGIYSSQVVDVCDFLNRKYRTNIRICAFLSIREYKEGKPKLKAMSPNALVFPAFPGIRFYQWTSIFLFFVCLFTGERKAICRNVFCAKTALLVKKTGLLKTVVLDARSSLSAEIHEYNAFPSAYLHRTILAVEKQVVSHVDYMMSISQQLVSHFSKSIAFSKENVSIIPCTLDTKFFTDAFQISENRITQLRKENGFETEDIIFVYAGSTAPWQSFDLMKTFLEPYLKKSEKYKVLFLSKLNAELQSFKEAFPKQVLVQHVTHDKVVDYLSLGDYGLLLRNQSVTNLVASPTKFGEYLFAGLQVLISEGLGDFSEFVKSNKCGIVVKEQAVFLELAKVNHEQKIGNNTLAKQYFYKDADRNINQYKKMLDVIT
jgi:hypothetical protein